MFVEKICIGYVLKSADVGTLFSGRNSENSSNTHAQTSAYPCTPAHTHPYPCKPAHTCIHPRTPAHKPSKMIIENNKRYLWYYSHLLLNIVSIIKSNAIFWKKVKMCSRGSNPRHMQSSALTIEPPKLLTCDAKTQEYKPEFSLMSIRNIFYYLKYCHLLS